MTLRHRFCRSLVYLAALLLLLEDWLWDVGMRALNRLSAWPPPHRLEAWIRTLCPYAALTLFVLPALRLFPVKLLALWAMARGHALPGLLVIVLARLGGAAAVARIFLLTRPVLLTIAWFAPKEHVLHQLRFTIQVKDRVHLAGLLRNVRRVAGVNRILRERS
ncbi:hypothetical protein [Duganella vulcania]|uniref:hypothetical protein n=1 Tax=Duganella vulcania TaxID=2692166 RepID=UPI0020C349D7|nr:hypothetical protein [Duganella vulcania]